MSGATGGWTLQEGWRRRTDETSEVDQRWVSTLNFDRYAIGLISRELCHLSTMALGELLEADLTR
jgi:hypothetical protein